MVKRDSKRVKILKEKARRRSVGEGIFWSARNSFGDYYVAPFAIAINTSNSLVALLTSIAGILGPLTQIFSSKLMEKYSRKEILLKVLFYESLMWIPLIAIAILFYKGIFLGALPLTLLISFSFYVIIRSVSVPSGFSWFGDLVDGKHRGRWFSKRNLLMGFVAVSLAIIAAFFLDYFTKRGWLMFGFMILFFLAFASRISSRRMFKKMYEPKLKLKKGDSFSFASFLINAKDKNFRNFAIFRFFLAFTTYIYWPFIAIYLLRYLEFNYITYMVVILTGTVLSLLFLPLWGKFADKYGNCRIMYATTILIPIVPFLWILNPSPIYLVFVPSMLSGISWAGFGLAENNFIYDNVGQKKRGFAISYYNMFWGAGVFLGAGLGAFLIKFLKVDFIEPLFLIFIIGGISSMVVVSFWIGKIKEIRKTEKLKGTRALSNMVLKEAGPTLIEEAREIISIKKYLKE